jgi:hypothetical protein
MTSGVIGIEGREASLAPHLLAVLDRIVPVLNRPSLQEGPEAIIGSVGVALPNAAQELSSLCTLGGEAEPENSLLVRVLKVLNPIFQRGT